MPADLGVFFFFLRQGSLTFLDQLATSLLVDWAVGGGLVFASAQCNNQGTDRRCCVLGALTGWGPETGMYTPVRSDRLVPLHYFGATIDSPYSYVKVACFLPKSAHGQRDAVPFSPCTFLLSDESTSWALTLVLARSPKVVLPPRQLTGLRVWCPAGCRRGACVTYQVL